MLASCKSERGYERQYNTFGRKMKTTTCGQAQCQMGSVVWKREVPQMVSAKHGMKMNSIKFKLRSSKRGRVKECGMNLRKAKSGGG
jgi:hypothetical protein